MVGPNTAAVLTMTEDCLQSRTESAVRKDSPSPLVWKAGSPFSVCAWYGQLELDICSRLRYDAISSSSH